MSKTYDIFFCMCVVLRVNNRFSVNFFNDGLPLPAIVLTHVIVQST